jgi:hypothetical protein
LVVVVAALSGCRLTQSAESSGCTEESRALAERMAERHRAAGEPFCEYGTTWLVLADGDESAFVRVLAELERDGWTEQASVGGNEALESPILNESALAGSMQPYIAVDRDRLKLQLDAGSAAQ